MWANVAFRIVVMTSALILAASTACYAEQGASEKAETPAVEAAPPTKAAEEPAEKPAEATEETAEETEPGKAKKESSEADQQE